MTTHNLKTWPKFFKALTEGKNFEIRVNDRDYQVGDTLSLNEFDPIKDRHTGQSVFRRVTYISDFGQTSNRVVLALEPLP